MRVEYSFNGLIFQFPVRRSFTSCAQEIGNKVTDLEDLHFSVRKSSDNGGGYEIDLRAVSKVSDILSTVQTKNIHNGLKALKVVTIRRLRQDKKKLLMKSRKKKKEMLDRTSTNEYEFKEAL